MSSTTAAEHAPLSGRTALISGASRGIGLACAVALGAAGARLWVVGRDLDAMQVIGRDFGLPYTALQCDLEARDTVITLVGELRANFGIPDILVNNAGQFFLASIEQTNVQDFDRLLQVNLTSHFALARAFVGDMRARGSGEIVTIGSTADRVAMPGNAAYAASKHGSRAVHEILRQELRGSGVRATLISPGNVDTSIWDHLEIDERAGVEPRARMLSPSAVADALLYAVTRPSDVNIDELRLSRA